MKRYCSLLVSLAAILFCVNYKYEIDWAILGISYFGYIFILLLFIAYRHNKYFTNGYLDIDPNQIKWHYGGQDHIFNIASLRDIKMPKPKHFKKYGVDYFYLYFGDGQTLKLDPSFPNYDEVKKELLERIVHHNDLQFLQGKLRNVN